MHISSEIKDVFGKKLGPHDRYEYSGTCSVKSKHPLPQCTQLNISAVLMIISAINQ